MENVFICSHSFLKDALTRMRMKDTAPAEFRELSRRAAALIAMEALANAPLVDVEIETPVAKTVQPVLKCNDPVIVPILRAGVGMLEGISSFIPNASIGLLGMERDEDTHQAHSYYCKLPGSITTAPVIMVDPMLATGGTAVDCISLLKERGATDIRFLCFVAAPEGVRRLHEVHPDVPIYAGALDDCLNDAAYIVPGLGDAGDRIFGTLQAIR